MEAKGAIGRDRYCWVESWSHVGRERLCLRVVVAVEMTRNGLCRCGFVGCRRQRESEPSRMEPVLAGFPAGGACRSQVPRWVDVGSKLAYLRHLGSGTRRGQLADPRGLPPPCSQLSWSLILSTYQLSRCGNPLAPGLARAISAPALACCASRAGVGVIGWSRASRRTGIDLLSLTNELSHLQPRI